MPYLLGNSGMKVRVIASNQIGESIPSSVSTVYLPVEIPNKVIDSLSFG